MPKRFRLPFAPLGMMTGRWFHIGGMSANSVARILRRKFKDMKFTVQHPLIPSLPTKILAEYKVPNKEVTDERANEIDRAIDAMMKGDNKLWTS